MKKYNLINNSLGWLIFVIATVTYMMTLEPTASFWDCGEFISQGYKLEVGHPPGNPIFMLTANFFTHFASNPSQVAVCINAMSGLLSAGCILLLFWTITHLVRRLITKDDATEYSWLQIALIMGSGICGALAYAWSDTFWFSAVEGEVYAFSSFCTALTFWLILKWENRCNDHHSDRYLVAIAYVIGVSVAVHLLNLLCIPAIILVIYYKKSKNTTAKGSIIALLISFAIIVLILFGLVPGFVEMAQYSELLFVNTFGMGFNSGVMAYTLVFVALTVWTIYSFHKQASLSQMRLSFLLMVFFSGIPFIGSSMIIPLVITAALAVYLYFFCSNKLPVRILYNVALFIAVIFVGYSSYALILIRSNAQTPMDQNSPDNVFALGSYLNREQYGKTPLLYGPTYASPIDRDEQGNAVMTKSTRYVKEVKTLPDDPDRYKKIDDNFNTDYSYPSETKMIFPRLYDSQSKDKYQRAMGGIETSPVSTSQGVVDVPTFTENIRYFFQYQLNYMYWRYFLWNFAGRQNDLQGQGEINHGNWISGIPFIDNARLGDQDNLPDDLKNNRGHNVFYMLPLLLGLIGLLWQAYSGKRGIEQFWVVFFLFFMTGIAIVLYLNQTPEQPRERDYAYAGSFYAFAIWIGMGVTGLYKLLCYLLPKVTKKEKSNGTEEQTSDDCGKQSLALAAVAVAFGIFVPLQMVSQTWDDHDRSGRYACRDFGMNYLSSVDPNGIIFTSGDNDTFPLWYSQEVEGYRTDVRVVNMSYLATDWYMAQMRRPAYESAPLPMQANASTYAYDQRTFGLLYSSDSNGSISFNNEDVAMPATKAIADYYNQAVDGAGDGSFNYPNMYMPLNADALVKAGVVPADMKANVSENIPLNLLKDQYIMQYGYINSAKSMQLDIISSMVEQGWKRPAYFALTIPDEYYSYFENQDKGYKYTTNSGMAYALTPFNMLAYKSVGSGYTDKAYDNITKHFRWGGLDVATPDHSPYYDETATRMVNSTRIALVETAKNLIDEAQMATELRTLKDSVDFNVPARVLTDKFVADRYTKARTLLQLMEKKLPWFAAQANFSLIEDTANAYFNIADGTGNKEDFKHASALMEGLIENYAQYIRYYKSLSPEHLACLTNIDQYLYNEGGYLSLINSYLKQNPTDGKKLFQKINKQIDLWGCLSRTAQHTMAKSSSRAAYNVYETVALLNDLFPEETFKHLSADRNLQAVVEALNQQGE